MDFKLTSFLLCLHHFVSIESTSPQTVTVETDKGSVLGQIVNSTYVFQAIPYAQPPIGNLRYMVCNQ